MRIILKPKGEIICPAESKEKIEGRYLVIRCRGEIVAKIPALSIRRIYES